MTAHYEIYLTDDQGVRLAPLTQFGAATFGRVINGIGSFSIQLLPSFDDGLIAADRMVQVWRQPTGGRLGLWRAYFVRRWVFETTNNGAEFITFSGPDINDLLRRRIVAAYSGSSQAEKTDYADDMMKEIVTESLADGVAPVPTAGSRVWSDLSVQGDLGDGPSITKAFAYEKLLTTSGSGVLPALAQAAKEAGTEVFFDIVPNVVTSSSITFQFQTFTGQPGADVTNRVVFDQARGNMQNPRLEEDYTEEENYIYAGGQGEGTLRDIQQVYDTTRYSISQWNRCEGFFDATDQATSNGVISAGRVALEAGRPKIRFTATPVDTAGTRLGREWDFGYKVRVRYRNREFDAIVWAVSITVTPGGERVDARLEYVS